MFIWAFWMHVAMCFGLYSLYSKNYMNLCHQLSRSHNNWIAICIVMIRSIWNDLRWWTLYVYTQRYFLFSSFISFHFCHFLFHSLSLYLLFPLLFRLVFVLVLRFVCRCKILFMVCVLRCRDHWALLYYWNLNSKHILRKSNHDRNNHNRHKTQINEIDLIFSIYLFVLLSIAIRHEKSVICMKQCILTLNENSFQFK